MTKMSLRNQNDALLKEGIKESIYLSPDRRNVQSFSGVLCVKLQTSDEMCPSHNGNYHTEMLSFLK